MSRALVVLCALVLWACAGPRPQAPAAKLQRPTKTDAGQALHIAYQSNESGAVEPYG